MRVKSHFLVTTKPYLLLAPTIEFAVTLALVVINFHVVEDPAIAVEVLSAFAQYPYS